VRNNHWILGALALGLIALQSGTAQAQGRIGNASAITNQVEGVLRGSSRTLATGSDVHANEIVRTADASVAQLVFLDNTNLSVGPKSSVTLDRFVYDPDHNTGKVVVRATRGVFRFVTGSQPPQDYTIETPIATIGVRGTVFDLLVQANKIVVVLVSGNVRVTTHAGRTVWLTQPGTALTVYANGTVQGPSPWNGTTIIDTASMTPFPYFGGGAPFPVAMGGGGLQPFIGLGAGIRGSTTNFDVAPPFDVSGTAGVVDVNGGFLFNPMGSGFFVGPRVGALFGVGGGSISDPPASPGFTYKVEMPWTIYYEALFGFQMHGPFMTDMRVHGSIGGATTNTLVTATAGVFSADSSLTRTGVTASAGFDIPISPVVALGAQFRYINVPAGTVDIPGIVPIKSDVYMGTLGLTWQLSDRRLKRDIVPLGRLASGIRLYRYRYAWSEQIYVGAMAQEVDAIVPQAVMRGADGYLRVNYTALGLRLMTLDEWTRATDRPALIAD
jgi:hypothetical protein